MAATTNRTGLRHGVGVLAILACSVAVSPAGAQEAAALVRQSGVAGGLVVRLGCDDATQLAQLQAGPQYFVHGLDTSPQKVDLARRKLLKQGVYGPVSVDLWDGKHLPYADNLVNLIVADEPAHVSQAELLRVLVPNGVLLQKQGQRWRKTVKPWPKGMDEWTHYLHDADGNPASDDQFVAPPTRLQWIGTPRWSRHHDHMASLTAMVSSKGRLFYILDEGSRASIQLPSKWRLVARDAFNGVILWKRDIGRWNTRHYPLKSGPAHLLRRLVAVGDRVYVTLDIDGPALILDAATGKTLMTLEGSQYTREIVVSDGVVFLVADNSPSRLPRWRRVSTYVWDNTRKANPEWGWHGEPRKILAYDARTGRQLWKVDSPVAPCSLAVDARRVVF
ncbi:MAG TPA: methyltransferase domain-containing protein, partial [Planctomycetaceae bacterium]|nr:methyltransferase domain-containing protein [Planctomycetaceae bacterium]